MSNNVFSAENQQGSLRKLTHDPSETTRRTPFSKKVIEAYFLGALHDGTFSKNKRFRISQKGEEWLKVLQKLFTQLGYNSWIYKEGKDREIYVIETLATFLDFKFDPLQLVGEQEKISYIRGFFDAEGGIPKSNKERFYIQLTQKDKKKIQKLKKMLNDIKIETGKIHNPSKNVDPNYWRMYILTKSQELFVTKINSWHPRKIKTLRKRMKI